MYIFCNIALAFTLWLHILFLNVLWKAVYPSRVSGMENFVCMCVSGRIGRFKSSYIKEIGGCKNSWNQLFLAEPQSVDQILWDELDFYQTCVYNTLRFGHCIPYLSKNHTLWDVVCHLLLSSIMVGLYLLGCLQVLTSPERWCISLLSQLVLNSQLCLHFFKKL